MYRYALTACLMAAPTLAWPAEVTLTPAHDASIYGGAPGYNNIADGSGTYLWTSVTAAGVARRALLRFDLSALPAGTQVQQVQLGLYLSRSQPTDPQVNLHKLNAPWTEGAADGGSQGHGAPAAVGDVTWISRSHPTLAWAQPGGDFDPQASASVNLGLPGERFFWGSTPRMVADVQAWVGNPASNHGWVLIGVESGSQNAKRFESRESIPAVRPTLRVVYEPAVAVMQDDIPVPAWALGVLGSALAAVLVRRRRSATAAGAAEAAANVVRSDASERMREHDTTTRR